MTDVPNLKRHAALFDRMATALGIDLEEEAMRGRLAFDEIADAVLRCTGCSDPGHCHGALATGEARTEAPGYCRNRALMSRLAAGA